MNREQFLNEVKLREAIRSIIRQELAENQPATAPSKPKTEPTVAPGKPSTDKPKPRRPLGNPEVKPKPKATMTEAEMLAKIIKRFKSKKMNEAPKTWAEGYEEGYKDGYKDSKENKSNKFS